MATWATLASAAVRSAATRATMPFTLRTMTLIDTSKARVVFLAHMTSIQCSGSLLCSRLATLQSCTWICSPSPLPR
ncbi:hypothetical protein D3C81_2123930 [compost metagenome]